LVGMHQRLVAELRRSLLLIILNKGCDRGSHGSPWDTSSWWRMTWEGTEAAASQSVEGCLVNRPTGKGSVESGRPGTGSDRSGTGSRRSGTYGDIPAGAAVATAECAAVKGPSLVDTRIGSGFGTGGGVEVPAAAPNQFGVRVWCVWLWRPGEFFFPG
jgi:hypothetical protein